MSLWAPINNYNVKKATEIWEATPHTLAKLEILKNYLDSWFSIFGVTGNGKDVLYIDGFAGPGIYKGGESGSPIEALKAAAKISSAPFWRAGKINCVFIEKDKAFFDSLVERVKPFEANNMLNIKCYNCEFEQGFEAIKKAYPSYFISSLPLFAFIDPFGISGAPFTIAKEILKSETSEILVNFDSDGIARNYRLYLQTEDENAKLNADKLLTSVFGDESWKKIQSHNYKKSIPEMVALYKSKLLDLPKVKYPWSFEMRGKLDTNNYYLIFASQHPLGLKKMKNAMKRIDQSGHYSFSDARVGQPTLFKFDDPEDWAKRLYEDFKGTKQRWSVLEYRTLIETPFINPKSMMSVLDRKNLITVFPHNPKRRKGTFKDDTIEYIEFL